MGKTSKPILMLIADEVLDYRDKKGVPIRDRVQKMEEQGHTVWLFSQADSKGFRDPEWREFDIILAPNAWRFFEEVAVYFDLAVEAARNVRYGGKTSGQSTKITPDSQLVNPEGE